MPKITDGYRTQRREVILDAAMRCFARNGISGTTMADIHRESGMSVGGIYRYFASKQEILLTVTAEDQRKLNSGLINVITDTEHFQELLPTLMSALAEYRNNHPVDVNRLAVASWLESAANAELRQLLASSFQTVADVFSDRLSEWGIPQDEHRALTNTIRVLVLGQIALNVLDDTSDPMLMLNGLSTLSYSASGA